MKIKELFDREFAKVKIDKDLARMISYYRIGFLSVNSDHVEFFGHPYIGLQSIWFKDAYVNKFFASIDIDQVELKRSFVDAPYIETKRKVAGNPFNLTLVYLAHRFANSKLPAKVKDKAMFDLVLIFNYRTLSALHSNSFSFLSTREIAIATYEKLSDRFILKQKGSWNKYFEYRAEATLSKKGPHYKALLTMRDDRRFTAIITDMHNRISSTFILQYQTMLDIKEKDEFAKLETMVDDIGDKEQVKTVTTGVASKANNVIKMANEVRVFANPVMIKVITETNSYLNESSVKALVLAFARRLHFGRKEYVNFVKDSVAFTYNRLQTLDLTPNELGDIAFVLTKVRGTISNTRSTDPKTLEIRERSTVITRKLVNTKDAQKLTALRNVLILYLFALTYMPT